MKVLGTDTHTLSISPSVSDNMTVSAGVTGSLDTYVVGVYSEYDPSAYEGELPAAVKAQLDLVCSSKDRIAKLGPVNTYPLPDGKRLVIATLKDADSMTALRAAAAGRALGAAADSWEGGSVGVVLPTLSEARASTLNSSETYATRSWEPLATGFLTALNKDERFKGAPKARTLPTSVAFSRVGDAHLARAVAVAAGEWFSMQLSGAPANVAYPESIADALAAMAKREGLECEVLDAPAMRKLGYTCALSVGQGSRHAPRLVRLSHKGTGPHKVVLVGKGVTFDAGGYNIKTASSSIELMRLDMSGAAGVAGALLALARLRPNSSVDAVTILAENMVSEDAYRPGDIIQAADGTTVEVINTDAEGRLTLADALLHARTLKPTQIIDVATLTGACVAALGTNISGLMGDQALSKELQRTGEEVGELLWPLPLFDVNADALDGTTSDLINCNYKHKGGALSAALFLKKFVKDVPWAHLDIAGPSMDLGKNAGGSVTVRTLTRYCMDLK